MYTIDTDYAKIKSLASQMHDAFEYRKTGDGAEEWFLREGSPQWMTDVVFAGSDDTSFKYAYEFTREALDTIQNADDDEDSMRESIYEIEADIYTADLTGWLDDNVNHVSWLDEVMDNGLWDNKSAANLLQCAQMMHKQAVASAVLDKLIEQAGDTDDESEDESEGTTDTSILASVIVHSQIHVWGHNLLGDSRLYLLYSSDFDYVVANFEDRNVYAD